MASLEPENGALEDSLTVLGAACFTVLPHHWYSLVLAPKESGLLWGAYCGEEEWLPHVWVSRWESSAWKLLGGISVIAPSTDLLGEMHTRVTSPWTGMLLAYLALQSQSHVLCVCPCTESGNMAMQHSGEMC